MMVVDALHKASHHISAEEIFQRVKANYQYANISTVYRTIELLKKLDLITEIDLGDGCIRFHHSDKGHHHHLVCNHCGKLMELPEVLLKQLEETIACQYDFKANLKHLSITGICNNCQCRIVTKS